MQLGLLASPPSLRRRLAANMQRGNGRQGLALLLIVAAGLLLTLCRHNNEELDGHQSRTPALTFLQPPVSEETTSDSPPALGRRQLMMLGGIASPMALGMLRDSPLDGPAFAADAAAVSAPAAQQSGTSNLIGGLIDGAAGDLVAQLNSTGQLDSSFLSNGTGASDLLWLTIIAGIFFGLVFPFLKFLIAGASTLFFFRVFNERLGGGKSRNKNKNVVDKILKRLSGEPEDALEAKKLEVTRLNDELVGLQANIIEQADGLGAAQKVRETQRASRFVRAWEATLQSLDLTEAERRQVSKAVKKFTTAVEDMQEGIEDIENQYRQEIYKAPKLFGAVQAAILRFDAMGKQQQLYEQEEKLLGELYKVLPKEKYKLFQTGLEEQDRLPWLTQQLVPATSSTNAEGAEAAKDAALDAAPAYADRVYVLKFQGDLPASQTSRLSREISAILSAPGPPPSEVVLLLNSPGGAVTGYGLAAAELLRFKRHDPPIKLTVCVDEVAASGGYLMACCADRIICSPFAAIGSIGVISQVPNAAERLKREGLEFITTTAGKWKRTVTPFMTPSEEELAKQKEDVTAVYRQFADFVRERRPEADVEKVATGEVWFGPRAEELKLVDELKTSSQYLLECMQRGLDVFSVTFRGDSRRNPSLLTAEMESALLQALLRRELPGQAEGGGMMDIAKKTLSDFMPTSSRLPLMQAPQEQWNQRLLLDGYTPEELLDSMDDESRKRLLAKLLS